MTGGLFFYQGPATIGGVAFTEVSLREERHPFEDSYLQTWEGTAVVPATAMPPLFGMPNTPTLEVQLPDGRMGRAFASAQHDAGRWTLEITGEGPAPGFLTLRERNGPRRIALRDAHNVC